ncbi:hypothetical protein [Jiangella rhizosphaerae]|uniref:hypothetical protein n=1 Tax=Jiangella rhizosphaerae TaxID=2293569 RepID=UPI000E69B5A5|nr:hypothetical protein [Jiangella rhizosphaerae]
MYALSDPEAVGGALGLGIVAFGCAGVLAFFFVALTSGRSRGLGLGHLGARWLRATGILSVLALAIVLGIALTD